LGTVLKSMTSWAVLTNILTSADLDHRHNTVML
jgi:hypothetical protein